MATQVLRLGIDPAAAKRGARQFESSVDRHVRRPAREATGSVGGLEGSFSKLKRAAFSLQGVLAGLGVAFGVREMVQMAEGWRLIESRLGLVEESAAGVRDRMKELHAIAQDSRADFEGTAGLYVRLAQNADELGRSQQELLDVTEIVNKAIVTGGSESQAAAQGVRQLAQAFASGELRGDEFRSVMENLPGLSRAMAEGMGVSIGALREMANNGELTADVVVESLLKMKDSVDRDFASMPVTLGQAGTQMKNALQGIIGNLNNTTGATGDLAQQISDFAGVLTNNSDQVAAWAVVVVRSVQAVIEPFRMLIRLAFNLGQALGSVGTIIGNVLIGNFDAADAAADRALDALRDMGDALNDNKDAWTALLEAIHDAQTGVSSAADAVRAGGGGGGGGGGGLLGGLDLGNPELRLGGRRSPLIEMLAQLAKQGKIGGTLPTDFSAPSSVSMVGDAPTREVGMGDRIRHSLDKAMAPFKEGFSQLWSKIGPAGLALASIFDIVKGAMEPLEPVIDALREPLRLMGQLIGQTLAPVLEALVPVIEFVAKVFTVAVEAVGWFIKGIGWLVDKLIGWFTDWGEKLMAFGDEMIENARATRRAIGATNELADTFNEMTRVLNAPTGFKASLARFNATDPTTGGGNPGPSPSGGGGGGGAGPRAPAPHITFNITQREGEDGVALANRVIDGVEELARRGDVRAGNLRLSPAGV